MIHLPFNPIGAQTGRILKCGASKVSYSLCNIPALEHVSLTAGSIYGAIWRLLTT